MTHLAEGLLQVYTGDGKGKTTAACGLAVRALGRGLNVCFIQFVKGGDESGELAVLRRAGVEVVRTAEASSGLMTGEATPEDRRAAAEAWDIASRALRSGTWDLIILDEIDVALAHGLLPEADVVAELTARPEGVEVVCTGRGAPATLLEAADLVTEMCAVKHPYDSGTGARRGIEF